MKKFKRFIAVMALATVAISVVGCSDTKAGQAEDTTQTTEGKNITDEEAKKIIVAQVGETKITLDELNQELAYMEQMFFMQFGRGFNDDEEVRKQVQQMVLNDIINYNLILQGANELNIEVTDNEIQEQFDNQKANFESDEAFNTNLEQAGLTEDTLKENIKKTLTYTKSMDEIMKDISVTDDEARAYYEKNITVFTQPAGAEMAHILVETEEEAKNIKKQYDEGKDFAELAAEFGTDATKETGGSLGGFIAYDSQTYDADFLAGAKELGEGEVSDPVKTQFGWHLIKTTNVQPEPVVKAFEEVKEQAKAGTLQDKQYEAFSNHIEGLKEKIKVEIFEDKLA